MTVTKTLILNPFNDAFLLDNGDVAHVLARGGISPPVTQWQPFVWLSPDPSQCSSRVNKIKVVQTEVRGIKRQVTYYYSDAVELGFIKLIERLVRSFVY